MHEHVMERQAKFHPRCVPTERSCSPNDPVCSNLPQQSPSLQAVPSLCTAHRVPSPASCDLSTPHQVQQKQHLQELQPVSIRGADTSAHKLQCTAARSKINVDSAQKQLLCCPSATFLTKQQQQQQHSQACSCPAAPDTPHRHQQQPGPCCRCMTILDAAGNQQQPTPHSPAVSHLPQAAPGRRKRTRFPSQVTTMFINAAALPAWMCNRAQQGSIPFQQSCKKRKVMGQSAAAASTPACTAAGQIDWDFLRDALNRRLAT